MVTLTESAAHKLQSVMSDKGLAGSHGLRVFVQGGGCGGMQYGMMFDNDPRDGDEVYEEHGLRVSVRRIAESQRPRDTCLAGQFIAGGQLADRIQQCVTATSEQSDVGYPLRDFEPTARQFRHCPLEAAGLITGWASDSARNGPVFQQWQRGDHVRWQAGRHDPRG